LLLLLLLWRHGRFAGCRRFHLAAAAATGAADTAAARQHTHLRHGEPHHSDTEALATTVVALVIGQSLFIGWFVAPLGSTTLSMNDWTALNG